MFQGLKNNMRSTQLEQTHNIKMIFLDEESRFLDIKNFEIFYTLYSLPADSDENNESLIQNKSFIKINYFIQNVLHESLVYALSSNDLVSKYFAEYDNNFIVLPSLQELTLLEAIHSKLMALTQNLSFVGQVRLTDTDNNLAYSLNFETPEFSYNLPDAKDWPGEFSFWPKPWWQRYDISSFDNVAESAEEAEQFGIMNIADKLVEELDSIDAHVESIFNKMNNPDTEDTVGEVIDLDKIRSQIDKKGNKWKPTIV